MVPISCGTVQHINIHLGPQGQRSFAKKRNSGHAQRGPALIFLISLSFYWACTMHSDCCWCRCSFYLFNGAPILHLHQDFSSLHSSIKHIMSLISVGMVEIMGPSDPGRASKLPTNKLNLLCWYPLVPSLLLCFFSLHLLFSSSSAKSPRAGRKSVAPESFALSSRALLFLPPGKLPIWVKMEDWVWHYWHMKFFKGTTSGACRKCPEPKSKSCILRDVFKHLPW